MYAKDTILYAERRLDPTPVNENKALSENQIQPMEIQNTHKDGEQARTEFYDNHEWPKTKINLFHMAGDPLSSDDGALTAFTVKTHDDASSANDCCIETYMPDHTVEDNM
ncbi:hypothetical protein HYFRA_00007625 [Hymenoscyphus fraxineus]|uniref:Uncharacterized protein n=1 Tax=Hymenoscyphus fraxineus TaxID=746836 RepID=A0A9N9PMZ7_9HELO|nr:hypothetical protein HYFRA_00007625 [Hymenoscyphus fraxineus]